MVGSVEELEYGCSALYIGARECASEQVKVTAGGE